MQGRIIDLATGSAPWNMAVDQALLESVDQTQVPVIRFYQWESPALSLGYFQKMADRELHPASRDADCVRRATGGGAILHDRELTYSVALPFAASATSARLSLYRESHQAVADSLRDFGVQLLPHRLDQGWNGNADAFLCFQRRTDEDLIMSGYKILGSAQRRAKRATLQHGSLLLRASPLAPELPGIWNLGGRETSDQQVAQGISERLRKLVGKQIGSEQAIQWADSILTPKELERAKTIQSDRFASDSWSNRR